MSTARTYDDEVVDLCQQLLRIDTSNPTSCEKPAAEFVADQLADVGLKPSIFEPEPGRTSVVASIEGQDPRRGALLVHTHLDVVPAEANDWSVDPFAGEIRDGCVWGRGAVDMKNMVAMTLSVIRDFQRSGRQPPRNVVLAFLADEEAGGKLGAGYLVDQEPQLFSGCTEAIGEVGGFSYTLDGDRSLYPIQTAEKGLMWMRVTAQGRAGHGSMINQDNAVTRLCAAIARLGQTPLPRHSTASVDAFLDVLSDAHGYKIGPESLEGLGSLGRIVGATVRNTAQPTQLEAGGKVNVIPTTASALIDGRFLPGFEAEFERELDEVLGPDIIREVIHRNAAVETPFEGPIVTAMTDALRTEDPQARLVPYMVSAGTDAKFFSVLGIRCFGFCPLRLPPDFDFPAMFHGVDERVPLEALKFGVRVLDRFLSHC
jgi:acetylornithine deacetylase/succinyl-diaminopimelate desuccinylase-like protein